MSDGKNNLHQELKAELVSVWSHPFCKPNINKIFNLSDQEPMLQNNDPQAL